MDSCVEALKSWLGRADSGLEGTVAGSSSVGVGGFSNVDDGAAGGELPADPASWDDEVLSSCQHV